MKLHVSLAVLMALGTACGGPERFEANLQPVSPPNGEYQEGIIYFDPPDSSHVEIQNGFFHTIETVTEVVMTGGGSAAVAALTFSRSGGTSVPSYSVVGRYALSDAQEDAFNAGQLFIEVRTLQNPEGNLRGRITPVEIPFSPGY